MIWNCTVHTITEKNLHPLLMFVYDGTTLPRFPYTCPKLQPVEGCLAPGCARWAE